MLFRSPPTKQASALLPSPPRPANPPSASLTLQMRALDRKANKFEKVKVAKSGTRMWTEVAELAQVRVESGLRPSWHAHKGR